MLSHRTRTAPAADVVGLGVASNRGCTSDHLSNLIIIKKTINKMATCIMHHASVARASTKQALLPSASSRANVSSVRIWGPSYGTAKWQFCRPSPTPPELARWCPVLESDHTGTLLCNGKLRAQLAPSPPTFRQSSNCQNAKQCEAGAA